MNDKLQTKNPDQMNGDLVVFKNPTAHNYMDNTPRGHLFELKAQASVIIPKTLAIWFIGDFESPFHPTEAEVKAIYGRNKYHEIFCKVTGEAPEDSEPAIDEEVENPQDKLNELAKIPDKVVVSQDHLNRSDPVDPDRAGGANFTT